MQVSLRPDRKQKAESTWKLARSRVSFTSMANDREDSDALQKLSPSKKWEPLGARQGENEGRKKEVLGGFGGSPWM